ncbi:MAG: hypothetical protein M1826_003320 [Phylliscum demangeonii]|nr:MAG: hypothetical protein M1826_003320 [Phylliscum demangeonii]
MAPTERQYTVLAIVERTSSIFSVLGATFIIVTFLTSRAFHKPINRLVFYAAFGNIITNVATIVSKDSLRFQTNSFLCQAQGFLIQWFMIADPWWTLMMACNVYLAFFRRYTAEQLRAMEWKYLLLCYGGTAIPALVFLFVRSSNGVRPYGPATLWCWISKQWEILRIVAFYGPIWVAIVVTMSIYVYVGVEIYHKRQQLRGFHQSHDGADAGFHALQSAMAMKGNEVRVTKDIVTWRQSDSHQPASPPADDRRDRRAHARLGSSPHDTCSAARSHARPYQPYSVSIAVDKHAAVAMRVLAGMDLPPSQANEDDLGGEKGVLSGGGGGGSSSTGASALLLRPMNDVVWSYTRAAMAYFIAMLVTWVPSSIYRVYGIVHPESNPFAFVLMAALVLPLQGFWNGIIYCLISQGAVKEYVSQSVDAIAGLWGGGGGGGGTTAHVALGAGSDGRAQAGAAATAATAAARSSPSPSPSPRWPWRIFPTSARHDPDRHRHRHGHRRASNALCSRSEHGGRTLP